MLAFGFTQSFQAQSYILGRVLDELEVPYGGAEASLRGPDGYFSEQNCTHQGVFRFENLKPGKYYLVVVTPYGIRKKDIDLKGSIDVTLHVSRNIEMDEVSVIANKAGNNEPVVHDDLLLPEIKRRDFGLDMPYMLEATPSLVATSDAGNGVGYSGLRIRGTDPTRIGVTWNGIPVNDAESHNVFWVDLPDISSSTNSIQVQRGIGWSQPGAGDFGGSIQLNTLGFKSEPYTEAKLGYGSFDTKRIMVGAGSGLINGRFTAEGRVSYLESAGYVDRAESRLYSLYGAGGYHHDNANVRFIIAHGDELTYQAWNGLPAQFVDVDSLRTYNSAGAEKAGEPHDNEVDDYAQTHFQLHYDQTITPFARFVGAAFYTRGKGFFEQYKADQDLFEYALDSITPITDLIRQRWLDNHFYGFTGKIHLGAPTGRYFILGGGWNQYKGRHFGEITWIDEHFPLPESPYYDNDAVKRDWNLFGRTNMKITDAFNVTVDLQGRWIRYAFEGKDQFNVPLDQTVNHGFFNPKLGLQYSINEEISLVGLTGIIHKEPNREDYTESSPLSRPVAERLWDTEIGLRWNAKNWIAEIGGYAMIYKDQLVPTGRLNDVGAYTRVNVDKSSRLGTEIILGYKGIKDLSIDLQTTLSDNKIKTFESFIDNWDTGEQESRMYSNTPLAFSPSLLSTLSADYIFFKKGMHSLRFNIAMRYIGKQFVDNTGEESASLNPYTTGDAGVFWNIQNGSNLDFTLKLQVRNLWDEQYESNGWIYRYRSEGYDPVPDDPYSLSDGNGYYYQKGYFPQAGRQFMVQAEIRF